MKLEVGQVWRRPDGTTWRVHSLHESPRGEICMKQLTFKEPDEPFALRITDAYHAYPARVVEETWTLVPRHLLDGIDLQKLDEEMKAMDGFAPTPLPDEGT